jgi:hypothetical protein
MKNAVLAIFFIKELEKNAKIAFFHEIICKDTVSAIFFHKESENAVMAFFIK